LFEHHYGLEIPQYKIDNIRTKIARCIGWLFKSYAPWKMIMQLPPSAFLSMEKLDSFIVDGCRAFSKPDLAVKVGDKVTMYDWKTGKARPTDDEQILTYALFAAHKGWAANPENLELVLVYMNEGFEKVIKPTKESLDEQMKKIEAGIQELRSLLMSPESSDNEINQKLVSMTRDVRTCLRCNFRAACDGAGRTGAGMR
jgi:hypothetical protein